MDLPDEAIKEYKEIYKKDFGKELSDSEANESIEQLAQLFRVLYDAHIEQCRKNRKLKEYPKGYRLDASEGTYTCIVCGRCVTGSDVWWDKSGPKCDFCQKALWKKIYPRSVCKDKYDTCYATWELERIFGIKPPTARKLIREGKIKARIIPDDNGRPHHYVILKKENPRLVEYEEQHKYMNEKCKCSDPRCSYCLQVVCLQKDCLVHPLEKKMELRTKLIEQLETERDHSLERSKDEKLSDHIRNYNKESAEEKEKHIRILADSINLEKRPQKIYKRVLITGIPGSGKTTIGKELEKKHEFKHVDMDEPGTLTKFTENTDEFIKKLKGSRTNIVITWEFVPETQTDFVIQLKNEGFKLIWFDGNREAAIKAFKKRNTVPEEALYIQLGNIENFKVVERIDPLIYNTFNKRGYFKTLEEIVRDINNL
jgi:hypothetical protein